METKPNKLINTLDTFGVKCNFEVFGFEKITEHVPEIDLSYRFDPETTLSILAGFANNRRVLIQGYHGTGCLLYTSPSPRDRQKSRMPSSA